MNLNIPVVALSIVGILIAVAGNMAMVAIGLVAVFGAGLLDVIGVRVARS